MALSRTQSRLDTWVTAAWSDQSRRRRVDETEIAISAISRQMMSQLLLLQYFMTELVLLCGAK